jgi:integrase/recombinase XerD
VTKGLPDLVRKRLLTAAEFHHLADIPPEAEWFKNLRNASTKRAYENAIRDFHAFYRHPAPEGIPHCDPRPCDRMARYARRQGLSRRREFKRHDHSAPASALSSLFQYLCDRNAVTHNPVKGVKRPRAESDEGKTPALGGSAIIKPANS